MSKLPKGLEHPAAFRQFVWLADQDSDISFPDEDDLFNAMYEQLNHHDFTQADWLKRGEEVIAFLEHALNGPYSDEELALMWFTSGAQIYFLPKDVRDFLTHMLGQVRILQEQNRAGTFVPFRR